MARGWESKSVEAQQDAWSERRSPSTRPGVEDQAVAAQRDTLMLMRTRTLADLQRACVPAHRAMLEQAIADLDARLEALAATLPSER